MESVQVLVTMRFTKDLLDRLGHVGGGDTMEAFGELDGREGGCSGVFDLAAQFGKARLDGRHVDRLSRGAAKGTEEVVGLDSPEKHIGVRHGQRPGGRGYCATDPFLANPAKWMQAQHQDRHGPFSHGGT